MKPRAWRVRGICARACVHALPYLRWCCVPDPFCCCHHNTLTSLSSPSPAVLRRSCLMVVTMSLRCWTVWQQQWRRRQQHEQQRHPRALLPKTATADARPWLVAAQEVDRLATAAAVSTAAAVAATDACRWLAGAAVAPRRPFVSLLRPPAVAVLPTPTPAAAVDVLALLALVVVLRSPQGLRQQQQVTTAAAA